jgi:hypothetical protein
MSEESNLAQINQNQLNKNQLNNGRRRFLRNAAMTIAAAEFALLGSAGAKPNNDCAETVPPTEHNPTPARRSAHSSRSTPAC